MFVGFGRRSLLITSLADWRIRFCGTFTPISSHPDRPTCPMLCLLFRTQSGELRQSWLHRFNRFANFGETEGVKKKRVLRWGKRRVRQDKFDLEAQIPDWLG